METFTLSKNEAPKFIDVISRENIIYAPVNEGDLVLFKQIQRSSDVNLNFSNSDMPPKSIVFPQTETLYKYVLGKKGKIDSVKLNEKKSVIFGIRPCDAKSFAILDQLFAGDYEDPYFNARRKNSVLVGLSCNNPGPNCFCTSFDDSPVSAKNMDILFTDIGDDYYVEVASSKGKKLVATADKLLKPAIESDGEKKQEKDRKTIEKISRRQNTSGVIETLDRIFENPFWKSVALKCIGCGTCTYLCPTCHCFDIQDESVVTKGARIRVWDTCMNPEYTLQASGYNPRPSRTNRVRNRIYHKYNYFPKNYSTFACVGCGRCIDKCPVNIDIIDIMKKVGEIQQ